MTVKETTARAAAQLNLPPDLVWKVYKNYWKSIREFLSSMPLKGITEEEFEKLQTSINIPSLGKFYVDWKSIKNQDRKHEIYKDKKSKASVHDSANNT